MSERQNRRPAHSPGLGFKPGDGRCFFWRSAYPVDCSLGQALQPLCYCQTTTTTTFANGINEVVVTTKSGGAGFRGVAVTANGKAVFVPGSDQAHVCQNNEHTQVGILDLTSGNWETFEATDCSRGRANATPLPANGWHGAAAVGNKVVFAPAQHFHTGSINTNYTGVTAVVGVFDVGVQPYTLTRFDISSLMPANTQSLFDGAVAVGTVVVFTPQTYATTNKAVGVFDPNNLTEPYREAKWPVSLVVQAGAGGGATFQGAVAVGNKAVFCPFRGKQIMTYAPELPDDQAFELVDISSITTAGDYLFHGGAAVGTKVYCAPWQEDGILVYDVETKAYDLILVSLFTSTGYTFYSAAALGPKVYFAPGDGGVLLSLDTTDNSTHTDSSLSSDVRRNLYSYYSGVSDPSTGSAIFSPQAARAVLLIRSTTTTTTFSDGIHEISLSTNRAGYVGVAVTASGKAVFAPSERENLVCVRPEATEVGILDVISGEWETFQLTDCSNGKANAAPLPANGWYGAAAVGDKVVFAPAGHRWTSSINSNFAGVTAVVGVFDVGVQPYKFTRVDISSLVPAATNEHFYGAVTVGSVVVLTPQGLVSTAQAVGVFDPNNATQPYREAKWPASIVVQAGATFANAVAAGNKAVACPYRGKQIMTYAPELPDDQAFEVVDISSIATYGASGVGFHGGAAVGTKVYCAPYEEDGILVYDVDTKAYDLILVSLFASGESFFSAAALGPIVYFAPGAGAVLLSLDTRDNSTHTNGSFGSDVTYGSRSYSHGTADASSGTVVFSPFLAKAALLIRS